MTIKEAIEKIIYLEIREKITLKKTDCTCESLKKGVEGTISALSMAIEALKKQEPRKPKEYEDKYYACPNCRNVLLMKWEKYNTELMDKSNGLPYCLNCGQAIDWSEEK